MAQQGRRPSVHGSAQAAIALVLTDVVMPQVSGPELAGHIRSRAPDARVVFMSSYSDDLIFKQGVVSESDRLLYKPFTEETLLAAVRAALDGDGSSARIR